MKKASLMKRISALLLLTGLMLGLILIGLKEAKQQSQQRSEGAVTLTIKSIGNTTTEKFRVKGATALDVLKRTHNVALTYSNYIKCIDGVCVNKEYMWFFYINNKSGSSGADKYRLKDGDSIRFEFTRGG